MPAVASCALRLVAAIGPDPGSVGVQALVRRRADIDQQGPVGGEHELRQRVAIVVQPVVGQAGDHVLDRGGRIGGARVEAEDPAHLADIGQAVGTDRQAVRQRQAGQQGRSWTGWPGWAVIRQITPRGRVQSARSATSHVRPRPAGPGCGAGAAGGRRRRPGSGPPPGRRTGPPGSRSPAGASRRRFPRSCRRRAARPGRRPLAQAQAQAQAQRDPRPHHIAAPSIRGAI
jgi:hypothetical protein